MSQQARNNPDSAESAAASRDNERAVFATKMDCPNPGKNGCLCRPRCRKCGVGIHGVAHSLPVNHPLYHALTP